MDWIDGDVQSTTLAWEEQLGVDSTRLSCRVTLRNTPQKCVDFVRTSAAPGIHHYFSLHRNRLRHTTWLAPGNTAPPA